jgi:hypothetical protein
MSQFDKVEKSLNQICNECLSYHTEDCKKSKCNIGFALNIIQHVNEDSLIQLDDGDMLIPRDDMKYYKDELIAKSIAEICKLCKECRENHSEKCIISICRRSLENTIFKESLTYPGNVLLYLMEVSKQNPTLAELIKCAYQNK